MRGSVRLALSILLLWVAGMMFYVAFHPGGVQMPDGTDKHGNPKTHAAKNPVDVFRWFINEASKSGAGGQ